MQKEPTFGYQELLKGEFELRLSKNSRYSMRAFARDIGMTPQMLSSVFNKKKDLSVDTAAEIANRLGYDPIQTQDLLDSVVFAGCKTDLARNVLKKRIEDRNQTNAGFRPLNQEMFKVISDWYHYAILELTTTPDFKSDPRWIATRLGLTVFEVKEAISRLKSLELLDDVGGKLKKTEFHVSALSEVPSGALRQHAKQILTKGISALDEQNQNERDISSMTMAIDPDLLPEAKKMIKNFRRKLCAFLESGKRSEIYVFAPALFRVSNKMGSK